MGGPVGPVQVLLGLALRLVRVGDLDQVLRRLRQVGGVQPGRLVEQDRLTPLPDPGVEGEPVDRVHDHRGLLRGDPAGQHRLMGRGPLGHQHRRPAGRSGARRRGGSRPGG